MQALTGGAILAQRREIVEQLVASGAGRRAAEASVSRAAASLERKGLLRRERSARSGEVVYWPVGGDLFPEWEAIARAEEDLALHCARTSRRWAALAARARGRARAIRNQRSLVATEADRRRDLEEVAELEG